MARYVIANRLAGNRGEQSRFGQNAVLSTLNAFSDIVSVTPNEDTIDRKIATINATPDEIEKAISVAASNIIIEPEILLWPTNLCPPDLRSSSVLPTTQNSGSSASGLDVSIVSSGSHLENALVRVYIRRYSVIHHIDGRTDSYGYCHFDLPDDCDVAAIIVMPQGKFWSMIVRGPSASQIIECPPLPESGPLGWWHQACGISPYQGNARLGQGIRVGVVDTGFGPHYNLNHVHGVGSFIQNIHDQHSTADVDSHGTHVVGTIAAILNNFGDFEGVSSGVEAFVARVFDFGDTATRNGDVAAAIDYLSEKCAADLINLSLGSSVASALIHDAIKAAAERGTLCICAAGNGGGDVDYPAAYPETIAVAAVGKAGWAPAGSLSDGSVPRQKALFGDRNLFIADFNSFGCEIDCAAPGVGILATVPDTMGMSSLYGGMDGTSMASPVACGILAALLAQRPGYLSLPRDSSRTQAARNILMSQCRDLGISAIHQGRGIPTA